MIIAIRIIGTFIWNPNFGNVKTRIFLNIIDLTLDFSIPFILRACLLFTWFETRDSRVAYSTPIKYGIGITHTSCMAAHHTFYHVTSNINLVTDNEIGWINSTANKLNTKKKKRERETRALFVTLAAIFCVYLSIRFAMATYFDGIISICLIEWEFPRFSNVCKKFYSFFYSDHDFSINCASRNVIDPFKCASLLFLF